VSKTARVTICAVPLVLVALIGTAAFPDSVTYQLAPFIRNISSGLFLTAGVVRMAAWRLTRDWVTARSAIALLALGTALPSTSVLRLIVHDGQAVVLEAPETRLLFALPIIALAIAGARHNPRLMRRTFGVLAVVMLGVPAVLSMVAGDVPAGEQYEQLWVATETCAAAGWAALAVQAWNRRRFSGGSIWTWVTLGLTLMATTEALKAWSLADVHAPGGMAGYVQLTASAIAVTVALNGLGMSIRAETVGSGHLTRALVDTQRRLAQVEEQQRRRLHDARSAIMGVAGASRLLATPGLTSTVDPVRLRAMVSNELDRLQGLLELDDGEPIVEFDLAEAFAAVVLARRLDGTIIDVACRGVRVLGRPRATATVLDNLLRNANRHAPRARVLVTARPLATEVEIVVSDDGPGIPPNEWTDVLAAGVRGTTARGAGSGLGLYSATRAMTAQFGSLQIASGASGGTQIVLRMPAAVSHAMAS
jgi:signal transduction histidine kinase